MTSNTSRLIPTLAPTEEEKSSEESTDSIPPLKRKASEDIGNMPKRVKKPGDLITLKKVPTVRFTHPKYNDQHHRAEASLHGFKCLENSDILVGTVSLADDQINFDALVTQEDVKSYFNHADKISIAVGKVLFQLNNISIDKKDYATLKHGVIEDCRLKLLRIDPVRTHPTETPGFGHLIINQALRKYIPEVIGCCNFIGLDIVLSTVLAPCYKEEDVNEFSIEQSEKLALPRLKKELELNICKDLSSISFLMDKPELWKTDEGGEFAELLNNLRGHEYPKLYFIDPVEKADKRIDFPKGVPYFICKSRTPEDSENKEEQKEVESESEDSDSSSGSGTQLNMSEYSELPDEQDTSSDRCEDDIISNKDLLNEFMGKVTIKKEKGEKEQHSEEESQSSESSEDISTVDRYLRSEIAKCGVRGLKKDLKRKHKKLKRKLVKRVMKEMKGDLKRRVKSEVKKALSVIENKKK
jgi:hypothetical protein